jgi:phospholipid/cholesterol/gamma-HCH transport system substrate-binding protein
MAEITIRISDKALKIAGIVLGGICLAWVVLYLWSSGFFVPKYRLRMYISEAAELAVGARVRLDGIDVGSVEGINLAGAPATPERRIELVLRIEKRHQDKIRTDSTATLITEGLLGNRYVNILRGFSGSPIPPGGEIAATQTQHVTLKDFIDSLTKRVECLTTKKREARERNPTH